MIVFIDILKKLLFVYFHVLCAFVISIIFFFIFYLIFFNFCFSFSNFCTSAFSFQLIAKATFPIFV